MINVICALRTFLSAPECMCVCVCLQGVPCNSITYKMAGKELLRVGGEDSLGHVPIIFIGLFIIF